MTRSSRLPVVFINVAMTCDGKIATANRRVSSFGSRYDQTHLLELRCAADAVMAGARTADLNPITLGPGGAKYRRLRRQRGLSEYNLRIVVSGSGSVNPRAEVFKRKFSPVIVLTTQRAPAAALKGLRAVATDVMVCGTNEVDFPRALRQLRARWGIKRLLCEGGGEINDALFRAGVVDELHMTICPFIFGGKTAPTIADGLGMGSLTRASRLRLASAKRREDELYLVYRS